MGNKSADYVLQIVHEKEHAGTQKITEILREKYGMILDRAEVNSLLYGALREFVIRDKDEKGYPVWRVKSAGFEASSGLEVMFYNKLLSQNIITESDSQLDYRIENLRNGKTYHLDIAIFKEGRKYDIEVDGFEHIRADARLSIQRQIEGDGRRRDIEIDWMDNDSSYADFGKIDSRTVFKWLLENRDWCIRYHEELLKPHDITRNIYLFENGWKVVRFWNFEINDNLSECLSLIKTVISK